ncbi:MAG: HAMP domain-containing protein [Okeania sp. SIO2G4]|nr:HAMP domain-containing protein [Okeania sp. SIO4D6]NEP38266.1 HAMP domain-containing protein [Okeania sp. SIO2H7]NEP70431.1 HAMP domain-containing protein [Okeania sp. SIO2G5]NEP91651.1 HAMP domain-containing protein [Okeania sp. SIO2F5]NEQ89653.1 HAMP domain-containing protein [Okeania sp. SIO2G4]
MMYFWKKSLLIQIVGSFLILSLMTISIVGYTTFSQARASLKESVFERLSFAAKLKENELNRWILDQCKNILAIAELPEINHQAKILLTTKKSTSEYKYAQTSLQTSLTSFTTNIDSLQEIFILTRDGRILVSSNPNKIGKYQPLVQYSEVTKPLTDNLISNFYLSVEIGQPMINFATPILSKNGKQLGMLATNLNLERIDSIIRKQSELGETVETYLVGNIGSSLSKRHALVSATKFGSEEFPDGIESDAINAAMNGNNGKGLYQNYKSVPVIGVYRWLKEHNLALLAEIHQTEAFAPARYLATSILLVGLILALVMAVVMLLLGHQIVRPILAIAQTAKLVSAGDLTQKVPVITKNEIGFLAQTFNQMIQQLKNSYQQLSDYSHVLETKVEERTQELTEKNAALEQTLQKLKETQAQLIQNEKMVSLGQLVAGVAHEINNPVNFIYGNIKPAKNYAENLLDLLKLYHQYYPEPGDEITDKQEIIDLEFIQEDFPDLLISMEEGSKRIKEIVLSLRKFSRHDESQQKQVDIHKGIDSTLLILQSRLKPKIGFPKINIIKEYSDLPLVRCLAGQLNQVFMNIIANAIDALEMSWEKSNSLFCNIQPYIKIQTKFINKYWIAIHITDNGMGMPEEVKNRIFDPFYTTKPVGKGTGLGLSLSYQIIVEKHQGKFYCNSVVGQGTEFVIELPVVDFRE